jgi:5-methylcytosine-specific restriction enzyme A
MIPRPTVEQIRSYYHSWTWRQLRARRRQLDGNQCQACGATTHLQVDHITAIVDAWHLRADLSNLITLCRPCHARKTKMQRRARGPQPRPRQRRSRAAQALAREIGR